MKKYTITAERDLEEMETSTAKDLTEAKKIAKAILKDEGATTVWIWFTKNYPNCDYLFKMEAV
jgi:ssDNA-binding Zn-finger/Zn-ribbon topoisomerase 1